MDEAVLRQHVSALVNLPSPRNYLNITSLNQAADYIEHVFKIYSKNVSKQEFFVHDHTYKNIICSFGPEKGERIVVGAHYDVCGLQPGADDNASAVSGLLELSRLLKTYSKDLKTGVDLVAYSLEEPPFFGTEFMGSAYHAKDLKKSKIKVKAMICLEMIGYFTNEPKSQKYPVSIMGWFYPGEGNFISVVTNYKGGLIGSKIASHMKNNSKIKVCYNKIDRFPHKSISQYRWVFWNFIPIF